MKQEGKWRCTGAYKVTDNYSWNPDSQQARIEGHWQTHLTLIQLGHHICCAISTGCHSGFTCWAQFLVQAPCDGLAPPQLLVWEPVFSNHLLHDSGTCLWIVYLRGMYPKALNILFKILWLKSQNGTFGNLFSWASFPWSYQQTPINPFSPWRTGEPGTLNDLQYCISTLGTDIDE